MTALVTTTTTPNTSRCPAVPPWQRPHGPSAPCLQPCRSRHPHPHISLRPALYSSRCSSSNASSCRTALTRCYSCHSSQGCGTSGNTGQANAPRYSPHSAPLFQTHRRHYHRYGWRSGTSSSVPGVSVRSSFGSLSSSSSSNSGSSSRRTGGLGGGCSAPRALLRGPLPPSASPSPSSPSSSPSSPSWSPNPMELVRREAGLQSTRIDPRVRERVEEAVERLGCRVTLGDVAARAGVRLEEADGALKALAYDTQASLQVSSEGEVVYGFAADFRTQLRNRSVQLRAAPLLRRAAAVVGYLTRVAFGTALVASVVVVWLAVLLLLSNAGRSDDREDRGRGGMRWHGGGGVRMFVDLTDLLFYMDPNYYSARAQRAATGSDGNSSSSSSMSFPEAIFSFVFGEGDPNAGWEERRYRALGEAIRAKGGVVTAEEMAPFLDPPAPAPLPADPHTPYAPYPDESFVLPALIKFGGEPVADEQGRLLYRFPALQRTAVRQTGRFFRQRQQREAEEAEELQEEPWELTTASSGQVAAAVALGLLNLLGVALLGGLLADPRATYLLAAQGLGWLPGLLAPLQLYAAAFFAIPGVRWLLNSRRNAAIEGRNEVRSRAAELLRGGDVLQAAAAAAAAGPAAAAAARAGAAALVSKMEAAREVAEQEAGGGSGDEVAGGGGGRRRLGPRLVSDADIVREERREEGLRLALGAAGGRVLGLRVVVRGGYTKPAGQTSGMGDCFGLWGGMLKCNSLETDPHSFAWWIAGARSEERGCQIVIKATLWRFG
ncbi:hypothetical protein Agub_g12560 [Astrephomene gubernaculifera]|uniref:Iron-sulfur cluster biosynthesis family protein n=1 Tax=Astrephomene gubernaculifera TaxID=47775 RepID=A0AAD3DYE5_9CHLO|nr:hypothetical protein Agub_g12560 [Astrephomene gubernaculifera]